MAPYELPLPREVSGLEHYVPAYLNVPVRALLLFDGGETDDAGCSTSDDLRRLRRDVGLGAGIENYCNSGYCWRVVVLFCGFPLVSIIDFSNPS